MSFLFGHSFGLVPVGKAVDVTAGGRTADLCSGGSVVRTRAGYSCCSWTPNADAWGGCAAELTPVLGLRGFVVLFVVLLCWFVDY